MKDKMKSAHMAAAKSYSKLSYCKRKQVGCIIVKEDRVISIGYNGTLFGTDNVCEGSDGATLPTVIHAEMNAITKLAKTGGGGKDSALFVTCSPCLSCAVHIIQSGIKEVYYGEVYRSDEGLKLLIDSGVLTELVE